MIAKKKQATLVSDFRATASIRLLYKIFSYMILARIEPILEEAHPEEQHGFRPGRRLEEHLLTATVIISKTLAADVPIWIVSLDLCKAIDGIEWGSVGQVGFDLGDGLPRLLDLRLADDVLLFCRSAQEARATLDSLVWHLANVGSILNAEKTVVLTTEAQLPPHIRLAEGQLVAVLPRHATTHAAQVARMDAFRCWWRNINKQ